jgi:hypothetical protein
MFDDASIFWSDVSRYDMDEFPLNSADMEADGLVIGRLLMMGDPVLITGLFITRLLANDDAEVDDLIDMGLLILKELALLIVFIVMPFAVLPATEGAGGSGCADISDMVSMVPDIC